MGSEWRVEKKGKTLLNNASAFVSLLLRNWPSAFGKPVRHHHGAVAPTNRLWRLTTFYFLFSTYSRSVVVDGFLNRLVRIQPTTAKFTTVKAIPRLVIIGSSVNQLDEEYSTWPLRRGARRFPP